MDTNEQQNIMDDAERAAVYYKTLVREGIDPKHASELTQSWILGWLRIYNSEPLPPREPWEDLGDGP